tara:strand:- start:14701 stop:16062 length:1362 start_codon:yes stop_codon:yes gene_type:complete
MSFGSGFLDGVGPGLALGQARQQTVSNKGITAANDILANMSEMGPGRSQGVPTEGGAVPVGYDGNEWDAQKTEYLRAMRKVTNPDIYQKMEDRMVQMEHGKIMELGGAARAALSAGDTQSAQKFLAGISYYTDPGNAPTTIVAPNGNIIMSEGDDMPPMVLTPQNFEEFLHSMSNYEDWREMTFNKTKHADDMAFKEKQLSARTMIANAELAISRERADASIASSKATTLKTLGDIDTAAAINPLKLERESILLDQAKQTLSQNQQTFKDTQDDRDIAAYDKRIGSVTELFDSYVNDPASLNKGGGVAVDLDGTPLEGKANQLTDELRSDEVMNDAQARALTAQYRRDLAVKPGLRIFAETLMDGLVRGDDNEGVADGTIASLALQTTMDQTPDSPYSYDPENNVVNLNGTTYNVADDAQPPLAALWGALSGEAEFAGGASEGGGATGITPDA